MSAFLLSRSLVYRTRDFLEEPWLIDHAQLMKLHDLIERHWISLEEERRSELERRQLDEKQRLLERYPDISEEELAERIPRWELRELERSDRSFVVWLQAGARIEADSLRDALDNPATRDHRIVRIEIELRSGNRTIQIQTRDHAGVRLETTPDTDSLAQRIFADLLRWKNEAQFPRWVGLWRLLGPIIAGYFLWLPLAVLVLTLIPSDGSALAWKANAQSLLEDNVLRRRQKISAAIAHPLRGRIV